MANKRLLSSLAAQAAKEKASSKPAPKRAKKLAKPPKLPRRDGHAPIPTTPLVATEQLAALTSLAPKSTFQMFADLLDPAPNADTYAQWIQRNLPVAFNIPLGPHQQAICDSLQLSQHGLRLVTVAPRGSGKSTFSLFGLPLAAIALGTHQFIVIIGPSQEEAESRSVQMIRSELDRNPALAEKWPSLRFIPRQRQSRKNKVDTAREIQLAGGRIMAVGAGSAIRGIVRENQHGELIRPDLILADDIETEQQVLSKRRTDRLDEWWFSSVMGLGSTRTPMSSILLGTTMSADALMTRAMKGYGRFATWERRRFPIYTTDANGTKHLMFPAMMNWPFIHSLLDPVSPTAVGPFTFSREYLLDPQDVSGALWNEAIITDSRWEDEDESFDSLIHSMDKIVIGVDPSWGTQGDECGIVVCGRRDGIGYVLKDLSARVPPAEWGRIVAEAYHTFKANKVVAEAAFGAEDVLHVMRTVDPTVPITPVSVHRGKKQRFEPIATQWYHKKVKMVGYYPDMERQMVTWTDESHFSPDRVDAMSNALAELLLGAGHMPAQFISPPTSRLPATGLRPNLRMVPGGSLGRRRW